MILKNPFLLLISIFMFTLVCAPEENKNHTLNLSTERHRARDIGIDVGLLRTGALNSITDVFGVIVGHKTIIQNDHIRTGVTAILPHKGNIFQQKVPAAIYCFNAFGKLAGYTQVEELGNIETPIILTNTLSVGTAIETVVKYILGLPGNETVRSVNAVVGETNDGYLNDIRGQHVKAGDIIDAIRAARDGLPAEGSVGAGTGTSALGYKGGIGTSSRLTPQFDGRIYTVGVLVQTNFGSELRLNGIPFSREMKQQEVDTTESEAKGSCMIVIATDAPLSVRNLRRLARRSFAGMARTTAVMSNSSGDYAIAFSTAYTIPYDSDVTTHPVPPLINNDKMTLLFRAAEEATEEAIYNSLFMATTVSGFKGHTRAAIPLEQVIRLAKKYNMHNLRHRLNWTPYE